MKRHTRRKILGFGLAGAGMLALAACAGQSPNGVAQKVAAILQSIVDGIRGVLSQLGLDNGTVATVLAGLDKVAAIIAQIGSASSGSLGSLVQAAVDALQAVLPLLGVTGPAGILVSAAASLIVQVLQLAGILPTASIQARAARMSPEQATMVMEHAKLGLLPH